MKILKILGLGGKSPNEAAEIRPGGIVVMGSGCRRCRTLYENVKKAAARVRPGEEVSYCADPSQAARLGVISMPALLDGGRILASGRVLSEDEAARLLGRNAGGAR